MLPEELLPPPCLTSAGNGFGAGGVIVGAGARPTSDEPQPIDNTVANPTRVATPKTVLAARILIRLH